MNKTTSYVLIAVVVGALVGSAITHHLSSPVASTTAVGQSDSGATFTDQKVALMVSNPSTSSATTTSVYNSDANDRMVRSISAVCGGIGNSFTPLTGAGLASFTLKVATSSTNAPSINSNTNLVGSTIVVSTSTPNFVLASSTPSIAGNVFAFDRWASGSYMTFTWNATNTAACTIGVGYDPT